MVVDSQGNCVKYVKMDGSIIYNKNIEGINIVIKGNNNIIVIYECGGGIMTVI